jgi:hypothetical protein
MIIHWKVQNNSAGYMIKRAKINRQCTRGSPLILTAIVSSVLQARVTNHGIHAHFSLDWTGDSHDYNLRTDNNSITFDKEAVKAEGISETIYTTN